MSSGLENTSCNAERNVRSQCQNLTLYDVEVTETDKNEAFINDKALRMMAKMGYQVGAGLGKHGQGSTEVVKVSQHLGKRGLGLKIQRLESSSESWDFDKEVVSVKEPVSWLENRDDADLTYSTMQSWTREGSPKLSIEEEIHFCDKDILVSVLTGKNIFDELDLTELCRARAKANPFESIRSVFFMNRAALKMANIDAATDFMFTEINKDVHHHSADGPYFFADVCAGPGGFTEYVLWRKKWMFKGFGFTLKHENDFKLNDSVCASPTTFQAYYGASGDGNVCCPDNIVDFRERVLHQTENLGVHFMMSDGGFSVQGNENLQEVLSKNIYICQCLLALEIVREHGHFVTKLFDTFTPFSVGLLYLMWRCFEKVTILKPNASRPANSERYFVCRNLKNTSTVKNIRQYLRDIVSRLWELQGSSEMDVLEVVPLDILKNCDRFFKYVVDVNNSLGHRQYVALEKLAVFCRNPRLLDPRQEILRARCLEYWKIPDIEKKSPVTYKIDDLLASAIDKPEFVLVQPREVSNIDNLSITILDIEDWHFCCMECNRKNNTCHFYAAVTNSKVMRLHNRKWIKVGNLSLVKGTLLYGEIVKEWYRPKHCSEGNVQEDLRYKWSLHVVDAIRLGDVSLGQYNFNERLKLIDTYCKAVNHEHNPYKIRVRQKKTHPLSSIAGNLIKTDKKGSHYSKLSLIGFNSTKEYYNVNSVLLLKTNENQSFQSTYILRVQIFINNEENDNDKSKLSLEDLQNTVISKTKSS